MLSANAWNSLRLRRRPSKRREGRFSSRDVEWSRAGIACSKVTIHSSLISLTRGCLPTPADTRLVCFRWFQNSRLQGPGSAFPLSANTFKKPIPFYSGGSRNDCKFTWKSNCFSLFPCLLMYDRDKRVKSFTYPSNVIFKLRISQNRKLEDKNSSKHFLWMKNCAKVLI